MGEQLGCCLGSRDEVPDSGSCATVTHHVPRIGKLRGFTSSLLFTSGLFIVDFCLLKVLGWNPGPCAR
jgi:hypothetical protein